MALSPSSGLTLKFHPLIIVNISDHRTRVKSQSLPPPTNPHSSPNGADTSAPSHPSPPRVLGCVISVHRGRTVEIFKSFELLYDPSTHSLDRAFLEKKQELCISTGSDAQESDMIIHRALMDINENPVHVLLNPSISPAQKDLPVTIYESVAAHLTGIHSAIKMLNSRIRVLHHYFLSMQEGDLPLENSLLRQVSSLLIRLPAIESEKFQDDFLMEYNDPLIIYLAMFTNCSRPNVSCFCQGLVFPYGL